MKKIYLYLAMLAGVAVACDKAETDIPQDSQGRAPEVKMITETISGSYGSTTRATISNDDAPAFAWSLSDNIAVHVSNGTTGQYVFTSDTGASGADAAATSAKFLVVYPEGYSRDAFAVFPSSIVSECTTAETNYGQSGNKLDVKLPGSYTLAQVTGTTTPCPMIATNTEGSNWSFYQLCGLLRLTVNCIPPSTKRLEIDFDGKKVWGDFSIAADVTPGTSVLATSADDGHDVITITKDGTDVTLNNNAWLDELVLNIPLPTGTYTNVTITSYNALTGGDATITITQPFAYTASREYATKRTFNVPVISISGSKRVVFSPGNLIKTDNTYTVGSGNESYEFEATPFNTNGGSLGYAQGAPTSTSARGYFTWAEACSLGSLTINGVAGWRVLTLGEWRYIMESAGRSMKYGIAKWFLVKSTGDKYGLLIPPDCATTTDVAGLNSGTVVTSNVDIDAYLAKGFVFLPAEGCWYGSSWLWTNDEGYYWSTTQMDATYAYLWCFDIISSVITNSYNNFKKAYYTSVRLIREVN